MFGCKKSPLVVYLPLELSALAGQRRKSMAQQTMKPTTVKPLGNRVLVKRSEQKEAVKGGIILPESAKKKPESAEVIAVGPGKTSEEGKLLPMPVKVGDTILMDKYAGQEITIDDEEYMILRADDIVAIIS